ncbi:MAG: hypothetical protein IT431_06515 [Phycisphaerales bacterium]|nr:hypothetical protein [Phycisphaerales bacterium]
MKNVICVLAVAGLAGAVSADVVDQYQGDGSVYMAGFGQTDLAQSFQTQSAPNITGAGILLQAGIGSSDNVTISLWTTLPNGGGQMLASASAQGTAGEWVDVFWGAVAINPNTTYYLDFAGNSSLGIAGSLNNPYAFGQVYANSGYGGFPSYDYAFRTWTIPTPGALAVLGMGGLVAVRRRR